MPGNISRLLWISTILLLLVTPAAPATENRHPLEPLDLSSPRATLTSFLATGDRYFQQLREDYWNSPSRAAVTQLLEVAGELESTLDMSEIPPAARFEKGRDAYIYLYETLSRIELPPLADIPDATAFADTDGSKNKGSIEPASWTIPHTRITLTRVADGPRAGQFLFSASTVVSAEAFYEKTRMLPYRRDIPLKNYAEKRDYLSMASWIIPPRFIERLPGWLKHSVYKQAVWKWIVLALLIAASVSVVVVIHRLARRGVSGQSVTTHLRRLATPVTLLVLTPLLLDITNRELTLTGWVAEDLTLMADAIAYFSMAWIAWTISTALAEAVIALPHIHEQSLNAHLLRLAARILGVVVVVTIIFYVSSQLGAPLYGLVAGLGVGGIAIALAAQNTIEHFIGSLNLFADRPVRVGDFCRYGEDPTEDWRRIGVVESIGLRSTRIRGIDNAVTTIPNGDFSKMHLVNYSLRNRSLLSTVLGLRYETTDDQLRFVLASLRTMLLAHPRVIDEEPNVRFTGFGDFSLKVEVRASIDTTSQTEFRAIREDIYLRMMKIVADAGTSFAIPSRTVYHTRDNGIDAGRRQDAEAQVRDWASARELPFPNFTADYRARVRDSLDYPPEGSPEAGR